MQDVSFIICTRNRVDDLLPALDSIKEELVRFGNTAIAEIVVVDNGSTDRTTEAVNLWAITAPCRVKLVYEARPGLATARNAGLSASTGAILAFTDDDCRLLPGYLNDLFRHYEADSEPVIRGGRVELGDATDQPYTIKIDEHRVLFSLDVHPSAFILGCNMTMSSAVAAKIGRFDELFGAGAPLKAAEETDYVLRAWFLGIPVEYVPDMAVAHFHGRKKAEDINKLNNGYFLGSGALYEKYISKPKLLRHLYWDLKNVIREAVSRHPPTGTDISYNSHREMFLRQLQGMLEYSVLAGKARLAQRKHLDRSL